MSQATDLRADPSHAAGRPLPAGLRIRDYEVRGVLRETWSGTLHLAYDHGLQRPVALEHWEPEGLSVREVAPFAIRPAPGSEAAFDAGLAAFVAEARLLARFDHPGIVRVWRFWEEHGTAWRVLPVLDGPTLGAALAAHGTPSTEAEARTWLAPLLDALAAWHAAGATHGALDPERVVLMPSGPVLLGRDAARRAAFAVLGTPDRALAPGYAAFEQYAPCEPAAGGDAADGGASVGPWSDLHAVGGLLRLAFTGEPPPPAPDRVPHDPLQPLATRTVAGVRETMLAAVDAALAPRPEQRPRHHAELRGLVGDLESPRPTPVLVPPADPMEEPFLGGRLRAEEITIPDLPLVERSAEIAEAISAVVTRPQPLAADAAQGRRTAPMSLAGDAGETRETGSARTAATAPVPWLDAPDSAAGRGGGGRRLGLLIGAFVVVALVIGSLFLPLARTVEPGAPRAAASRPETTVRTAAPAAPAVPTPVVAATLPAAPATIVPEAPLVPVVAASEPPPVAAGISVSIPVPGASAPRTGVGARDTRCIEILQKASLEGIGAADAEFYKRECR